MNPEELAQELRKLDTLHEQMDSVRSWLTGDPQVSQSYQQIKDRIEAAFPGLRVLFVNITYRMAHGLFPSD